VDERQYKVTTQPSPIVHRLVCAGVRLALVDVSRAAGARHARRARAIDRVRPDQLGLVPVRGAVLALATGAQPDEERRV
jgi:hypothetical protein